MRVNSMPMENTECECLSKVKKILDKYCTLEKDEDLIRLLEGEEEKIYSGKVIISKDELEEYINKIERGMGGNTKLEEKIDKFNYRGVYIAVAKYNNGGGKIIKIGSAGQIEKENNNDNLNMTKQRISGRITNTGGLFLDNYRKIRKEIKEMSENIERLIIYTIKIDKEDIEKGCELTPRALEAFLIALYIKITGELPLLHKEDD